VHCQAESPGALAVPSHGRPFSRIVRTTPIPFAAQRYCFASVHWLPFRLVIRQLEDEPPALSTRGPSRAIAYQPPAAPLQDRRTPDSACPVLHPAARRKLLDTVPVPADRDAYRAARVASDLIGPTAQVGEQTPVPAGVSLGCVVTDGAPREDAETARRSPTE